MPRTARAAISTEPAPPEIPAAPAPADTNEQQSIAEEMPQPPVKPADADFFEWIESLTRAEWEHCRLYLYRLSPEVLNAPGEKHMIPPAYSRSVTLDEISQTHGGGKYRAQLNWKPLKKGIASYEFWIEGAPKFLPGQTFKANGQPAVNDAPVSAGAGGMSAGEVASAIVSQLAPLLRSDGSQAEAQSKLIELMSKGNDKVLEMVSAASKKTLEDAVGQNSPNGQLTMLTALLGLVEKLQPKMAEQPNLIKQLGELAPLLKMLQGNQGGIIGEIREALGAQVVERLFNPDSGQGSDWKSQAANAAVKLIEQIPNVLDKLVALQRGAQPAAEPNPPPGTGPILQGIVEPGKPPAPPAVASSVPAGPIPVAVDVSTAPALGEIALPLEALRDGMMKMIVECFDRGESGSDAVLVLSHVAEPLMPELVEKMRGVPVPAVMMWVRAQEQFAGIKDHHDLKTFVQEFQEAMMGWANDQAPAEAETVQP
jgi:hypothetical protein